MSLTIAVCEDYTFWFWFIWKFTSYLIKPVSVCFLKRKKKREREREKNGMWSINYFLNMINHI